MTCGEVFFELLKISIAVAALALTALTAWNSLRVYKTQSKQLEIAQVKSDMDRRAEEMKLLNESPRFRALKYPDGNWQARYLDTDGEPFDYLERPEVIEEQMICRKGKVDDLVLMIGNSRRTVNIENLRVTVNDENSGFTDRKGVIWEPYSKERFNCTFVKLEKCSLEMTREIGLTIQFETENGYEGTHQYSLAIESESFDGDRTSTTFLFRRVFPESLDTGRFISPVGLAGKKA